MFKKTSLTLTSFLLSTSLLASSLTFTAGTASAAPTITPVVAYQASAAAVSSITLADMPANLKSSIEWVWTNRMITEGSTTRKNLIFDQIFAGKGTINYVVRWQSGKNLTLQQRKDLAAMLQRQMNNWTKHLKDYDGWPYGDIQVKIVGWAVANSAQILDKQADEIIYTDYITDQLSTSNPAIPSKLPVAPSALSRFDHFTNPNYVYPGGLDKRFDMYLWATSGFGGGAGGDWGQRMSDDYILSTVNSNEIQITEHEIGHGFGLTDFYEANERPPGGFPVPTIMWAGNSPTITSWDIWMLRYTWSQIKKDASRFPATTDNGNTNLSNIALNASVTSSYVSPWESISALNDGFDPIHSNDRNHAVYGNWPETGTQWVQYTFNKSYTVTQSDVYWFKDNGGIDVPSSYKIKYWTGSAWIDVQNAVGLGTSINQYNTTTFTPVTTTSLRIEMVSKNPASTGILEWKVKASS